MKEEYIAKFQQGKDKLHLLKLTKKWQTDYQIEIGSKANWSEIRYQVRLNRKRIGTSISEYEMRKLFATYAQNMVLQLKIYNNSTPVEKHLKIQMGGQFYKGEEIEESEYNRILFAKPEEKRYPIARIDGYPCKLTKITYEEYKKI